MLVSARNNDISLELKACESFMEAFSTVGLESSDLQLLYEEIHASQRYCLIKCGMQYLLIICKNMFHLLIAVPVLNESKLLVNLVIATTCKTLIKSNKNWAFSRIF